jgi:outer membrane cobalamin receptor
MHIGRHLGLMLTLLVWAVLPLFGTAHAGEPITVVIDTVEVTATPILAEESVNIYGGSVELVGRQQVEDLNAEDLPSALRLLPGVTISRYNLLGSYGGGEGGSVYIRGQGAGRPGSEIKIYVDGVPCEVGVWSHPVMDIVPIDYASSIEVYAGPQPYSYPGTFGAVDINTARRHAAGYETFVDLTLGEHDTRGGVLRHGGRVGALDYYTGVTFKESEGHRRHADGRMESQFARLGLDASESVHIGYILQHTDNWSRDPGPIGGPAPVRDRFATKTLTHSIRLDQEGDRFRGFAMLYYEDGGIRWQKDHLSGPETPAGNSDTDWENYGFRGSEDFSLAGLGLTVGLEVEDEGGQFRNTTISGYVPFKYGGRFTTIAPAMAARYRIVTGSGEVVPSVGLRYYGHSRFASKAAPHAGLVFQTGPWKAFAAYARGISYPGVYAVGVAAGMLDELDPEVLDHAEAGVSATWGNRAKIQTSVYQDRSDNLIEETPDGLANVRDYEVTGCEISSMLAPAKNLSMYGALTVLKPGHEKTPRVPALSAAIGANYKPSTRLRLTLDAEYVDEQYAFNGRSAPAEIASVEKLPSHFVTSAGVGYNISGDAPLGCEVSLTVENLTDEAYAFQPGYEMPGRTLFLATHLSLE